MADRLESMAVFAKAAELGSFTKAAAALGLTSQMVGRHVAELEARLGVELIRRTTRRHSLTAIGEVFHQRCRAILAEVEAAEGLAHELGRTPRGRLRVNAPVAYGALCLAPVIGDFLRAYPGVDVELTLDDRYVDLVEEGFDVVLRMGRLKDSSLHARALSPARLVTVAAPAYLAREGLPAVPADLAAHACLVFIYSTGVVGHEWRLARGGESVVVEVASRLRSSDSRVLLSAALAGDGVLLQAERVLRPHVEAGQLVRVLPDWTGQERPLHLVYSPSRLQTLRLRAFVEFAARALG